VEFDNTLANLSGIWRKSDSNYFQKKAENEKKELKF
jgi:hypothetical protein